MSEGKIFISYRDHVSKWQAMSVYYVLSEVFGREVFIDKIALTSGRFGPHLLEAIANNRHFCLILTKGSFNGFPKKGAWFRKEIRHAMSTGRNIVPVLFDGFELSGKAVQTILAKYKLKGLRERQLLSISAQNFETRIIKLNEYLSGHDEISEKRLSRASKDIFIEALQNEQEERLEELPFLTEDTQQQRVQAAAEALMPKGGETPEQQPQPEEIANYLLSRFTPDVTVGGDLLVGDLEAFRDRYQTILNAIEKGTTPYIITSSDALDIPIEDIIEPLKVGLAPETDLVDGQMLGRLKLANQEGKDIKQCRVELVKLIDEAKKEVRLPAPVLLGWSPGQRSREGTLTLKKDEARTIDLGQTTPDGLLNLMGVGGQVIHSLLPGLYYGVLQVRGQIGTLNKLPKKLGFQLEYGGEHNFTIGL